MAKPKKKFAYELEAGDLLEVGGKMYEVITNSQGSFSLTSRHITLYLLDGHQTYDRLALFMQAHHRVQIHK